MFALPFSYGVAVILACCPPSGMPATNVGLEATIATGAYDAVDVVVGPTLVDTRSFVRHRKRLQAATKQH